MSLREAGESFAELVWSFRPPPAPAPRRLDELPAETPEFDTYFVYPEELRDSKRVGVFRDFLVSKAKEWSF